jgi:hypothetical protein
MGRWTKWLEIDDAQERNGSLKEFGLYQIRAVSPPGKPILNMAKLGFTVKELIGGLDWWKRDGHPTVGTSSSTAGDEATSCGCE